MILEMEPLAESKHGRVVSEALERHFGRAVLPQQSHMKVPIVGGAFCFLVASGGGPSLWQVEETIPMDPGAAPGKKLRGARDAPGLHFLGAERRYSDLGDPHWQSGHGLNLFELCRPLVNHP